MKTMTRLTALILTVSMAGGCMGGLRHRDRQLRDPVRLPKPPVLEETGPVGSGGPAAPGSPAQPPSPTTPMPAPPGY